MEVDVALENRVKYLLFRFSPEGWHTTEQNVENDATTPNISLRPVLSLQNLCTRIKFQKKKDLQATRLSKVSTSMRKTARCDTVIFGYQEDFQGVL